LSVYSVKNKFVLEGKIYKTYSYHSHNFEQNHKANNGWLDGWLQLRPNMLPPLKPTTEDENRRKASRISAGDNAGQLSSWKLEFKIKISLRSSDCDSEGNLLTVRVEVLVGARSVDGRKSPPGTELVESLRTSKARSTISATVSLAKYPKISTAWLVIFGRGASPAPICSHSKNLAALAGFVANDTCLALLNKIYLKQSKLYQDSR